MSSAAEDFDRCERFEQATAERASTTVEELDIGTLYVNSDLPKVWDRNFLWLGPGAVGASAAELVETTDLLLGNAGVEHRKFLSAEEHISNEVARDLVDLGWTRTDLPSMTLRDPSPGELKGNVKELTAKEYECYNRKVVEEFSEGGPDVTDQLVRLGTMMATAGNARFFVVEHEGEYVSGTHLYSDGRTAQIEDVGTLQAWRGRGFAKDLMRHVIKVAFDAGHDLLFLVAEADDWPRTFYERMGFQVVGQSVEYKLEPPENA